MQTNAPQISLKLAATDFSKFTALPRIVIAFCLHLFTHL